MKRNFNPRLGNDGSFTHHQQESTIMGKSQKEADQLGRAESPAWQAIADARTTCAMPGCGRRFNAYNGETTVCPRCEAALAQKSTAGGLS